MYKVILKDSGGYEIDSRPADNLKEAKNIAKYLLSDEFARMAESTHADLGTERVEVFNKAGECVWDDVIERTPQS